MNRYAIALVAALVAGTAGALNAAPSVPLTGSRIRSWSGGEGVRLGSVRQIVQDNDGYLWLASSAGLVRFDGVRFSTHGIVEGADLPSVTSRTVYLARDGALWVGYGSGSGVYRIRDSVVLGSYLQKDVAGFVNAIAEDRDGVMWIAHDEGLHRVRAGRVETVPLPYPSTDHRVFDVHQDRAGTLWIAGATAMYRRASDGAFRQASAISEPVVNVSMSEDPSGRVWITDPLHGYRPADGAAIRTVVGRGMNVFFDHHGNLWVATFGQGLWKIRGVSSHEEPTIARATVDVGLLSDELSGFLEDRDGNLWVGANAGLHRFTPNKAVSVVDVGVVHGVAADDDGTTWLGGTAGLVAVTLPRGGERELRRVVSSEEIRALHRSQDGTIWAATDQGLHRLRDGRLSRVAIDGFQLAHVYAMDSDRQGDLWVCDEVEGLVSVTRDRAAHVELDTADTVGRPAFVKVDSQDRLWMAFADGTLRMHQNGIVRRFGAAEGLGHGMIFTVHDSGDGRVWVGGDQGLSHFVNGRFDTLNGRNLPSERVLQIASDDTGSLWLGLPIVGFIRLDPEELTRALADPGYSVRYAVYTSSEGIAGAPNTFSTGVATDRNRRLWFVTGRGVTVFDPSSLTQERALDATGPRIEGVTANGRWYRNRPGLTLSPGITALRIDYARITLSSFDQVRFRYRLDGVDTQWVDGTGRRQASYTNLRPGDYRFRVQVTSTGTWDEPETGWDFTIAPAFYQTGWFMSVCVAAALLAVVALWRLRMRQMRAQLAAVYNERVRLSREIHDTLLQSLAGVAMQLDAVSSDARAPSRIRIAMVRMRSQIEEYVEDVRESIWNLRSSTADERDIVTALRSAGQRITSGRVSFALNVTGTPRSCESKVRTEVVRIAQEAMMNAVRHARARQVQLNIGFGERTLRLRVEDDGEGFDASAVTRNGGRHYGLIGMQERAAEIGGCCTIESTPGRGSLVVAEFPLKPDTAAA